MATQAQLDEARAAYHKLQTGSQLVSITSPDGRKTDYKPANSKELFRYIERLEAEFTPSSRRRRAIVFQY